MIDQIPFLGRMRAVSVTQAALALAGIDPMAVESIYRAESGGYTGWEDAKRYREAILQAVAFGDIKAISAAILIPQNSFGDGYEEPIDPEKITPNDLPFLVSALLDREVLEAWNHQANSHQPLQTGGNAPPEIEGLPRNILTSLPTLLNDITTGLSVSLSNAGAIAYDFLTKIDDPLYLDDTDTGLWRPVSHEKRNELLGALCFSDYVISNGKSNADSGWECWRVTPSTAAKLKKDIKRIQNISNKLPSTELPEDIAMGIADRPGTTLTINGVTFSKLVAAISAFPEKYPQYSESPPKLDADVRKWLAEYLGCSEREKHVFGQIIKEHFGLT